MSKTFVMIHGSWHCGWAWQGVMRHLAEKGHVTHAPTLPGHGPQAARHGIRHQDCVNAAISYIQERNLKNITLIGHSFGGTVVQKLAEELTDRITCLVFLDALIVEDGQCVFDVLPSEYAALFNDLAKASSNDSMLIPWEIWRDNFIQDAPEPLARSLWEQLSPEPNQVNLDCLDLKRFYSLSIPSSFIHCRNDRALPPSYFHPRMSSRLGEFKLVEMDGSHEVMFTRPDELADKIIEASID
jgi:pimeloyl-ACP methyl ester carboxylesterase